MTMTRDEMAEIFDIGLFCTDVLPVNSEMSMGKFMRKLKGNTPHKLTARQGWFYKEKFHDYDAGCYTGLAKKYLFCNEDEIDFNQMHQEYRARIKENLVEIAVKIHESSVLLRTFHPNKTGDELHEHYKNNKTINSFVENFTIEINFIPETVNLPKTSLRSGDTIYRVSEHPFSAKRFVVNPYDVKCMFVRPTLGDLYFEVSDEKGRIKNIEHNDAWGFSNHFKDSDEHVHFFISEQGAQDYIAERWSQIESQRQKYLRNRPKALTR